MVEQLNLRSKTPGFIPARRLPGNQRKLNNLVKNHITVVFYNNYVIFD